MTLAHWLERTARAHPDEPALALGPRVRCTYRELDERVARLAGWLSEAGAGVGARVAIVSSVHPHMLEALHATWRRGAAAVAIDASRTTEEIGEILAHAAAEICFACARSAPKVAQSASPSLRRLVVFGGVDHDAALSAAPVSISSVRASDAAMLRYAAQECPHPEGAEPTGDRPASSGPRAAVFSHHALMNVALAYLAEIDAATPRDAFLLSAPLDGDAGLFSLVAIARGGVAVAPETGAFDPAETFELAAHWRRASLLMTPPMLRALTESGADCDPTAFRTLLLGGADTYAADKSAALDRFGPRLTQVYGCRAFPLTIARLSKHDIAGRGAPFWAEKLGSVGRGFLMTRVVAWGADGAVAEPGEVGEIYARGPSGMQGYWPDGRANGAESRGDAGWIGTGDLGRFDAHGYLTLVGRTADVIAAPDGPLYPRPIEETLQAHPDLSDVAIIARPSRPERALSGSSTAPAGPAPHPACHPVAYVVGDADQAALRAYCAERLPPSARPRDFQFVDALPRMADGSVARGVLRRADRAAFGHG